MPNTDALSTYADTPTTRVVAENGIEYAYRDLGQGAVPLILLQHFRGNLDNWDPALEPHLRSADDRTRRADDVADPPSAVRRRVRLGDPEPLDARASLRDRASGVCR